MVSTIEGGCRDYSLKMKEAVPVLSLMGVMSPLLRRVGCSLKWGDLLLEESLQSSLDVLGEQRWPLLLKCRAVLLLC